MKQMMIRNLDDAVIFMLKKIAWAEGASPDDMARRLLIEAIQSRTAHPLLRSSADTPPRPVPVVQPG